jgi:hypothetical protein
MKFSGETQTLRNGLRQHEFLLLGLPVIFWNWSVTAADIGTHTVYAVADNSGSLSTTSSPLTVTVTVPMPVVIIPTIPNQGFETPMLPAGGYSYGTTGGSWTFDPETSLGGSGIARNNSAFTNANPVAPFGSQVAFIQDAHTIAQTINFPTAGSFKINFWLARRATNQTQGISLKVMLDNTVIMTPNIASGSNYALYTSTSFSTTAGNHVLKFVTTFDGYDNTLFLDNVYFTTP